MTTFQKIIKYLAIALAIFLTVSIISGIVGFVSSVFGFVRRNDEGKIDYTKEFDGIKKLDINYKVGKLIIKRGSRFKVEASNVSRSFSAKEVNGTLFIDESSFFRKFLWINFGHSRNSVITVYLPEDFTAESIKIDNGVGDVYMEDVSARRLSINGGAGSITGRGLTADKADIDGGVGSINLSNVYFSDTDLDSGVGDVNIDGIMKGKTEIDCGVGSVRININAAREDYVLKVDTGLGNIRVDGERLSKDYRDNRQADNMIVIDGGVGDVRINFNN